MAARTLDEINAAIDAWAHRQSSAKVAAALWRDHALADRLGLPRRTRGRPAEREYEPILRFVGEIQLITRRTEPAARRYVAERIFAASAKTWAAGRIIERDRQLVLVPKQRAHLAELLHVRETDLPRTTADAIAIIDERLRTAAIHRR